MITFQNDGLLDLRAIRTFGLSAKETANPIGFFGTGMKYAIAILCRLGQPPRIYRGLDRIVIDVTPAQMRGKDFSIITMDGEELGFTTDLGKKWEPWQAFRELYCNTMDEPGAVVEPSELAPAEGKTTIIIDGDVFDDIWRSRGDFLCLGSPTWTVDGIEIHDRPSSHMFYKGIRVGDLKAPASLTYNVVGHHVGLTEDRTVSWYWEPMRLIASAILKGGNAQLLRRVLTAPFKSYEAEIDFNAVFDEPSADFMQVMEHMPFRDICNMTAVRVYRKKTGRLYDPDPTPMDAVEQLQLQKALDFLTALDFPVRKDPITVTADLPENILGVVWDDRIFIARRAFNMGTKQVAMTILEEHLHLRRNLSDESREMQNFLFELVVTYAERFKGVPL